MMDQSFGAAVASIEAMRAGNREYYARQLLRWAFQRKLISGLHRGKRRGRPPLVKAASDSGVSAAAAKQRAVRRAARIAETDQRWNQIFEEKFADPGYYSEPPEPRILQSSLARILK